MEQSAWVQVPLLSHIFLFIFFQPFLQVPLSICLQMRFFFFFLYGFIYVSFYLSARLDHLFTKKEFLSLFFTRYLSTD
ncbi:hypothetical protein F5Y17DRAFT_68067 [Xylariaceae sp. FL0594]|nr:hypothetical protein F5Y17DRAFT_68067 [Xylariaceae sp. FL0594]